MKKKRIQSCLPSRPRRFLQHWCKILDRNFTEDRSYICFEPRASGASPWENTVQVILKRPVLLRSRIRRAKSIAHTNRSSGSAADWLRFQMTADAKSGWGRPITIRVLRAFSAWTVQESERVTTGKVWDVSVPKEESVCVFLWDGFLVVFLF